LLKAVEELERGLRTSCERRYNWFMQKWEYKFLRIADGLHDATVANYQGADGWELVSVVKDGTEAVCYFKRLAQSKPLPLDPDAWKTTSYRTGGADEDKD
jgi:hypothetical protein